MTPIILYTTVGCHLCERAEVMLQQISSHYDIKVLTIEIGDDDTLITRYGISIPVVKFADNTELNWPFERQDLERKIEQL